MRIVSLLSLGLALGPIGWAAAQEPTKGPPESTPAPAAPAANQPAAAPGAPSAAPVGAPAAKPASLSSALGLYVFPAKGQTADQQKQDEQACYGWAKEQSGIDPATVTANTDSAREAAGNAVDSAATVAGSMPDCSLAQP